MVARQVVIILRIGRRESVEQLDCPGIGGFRSEILPRGLLESSDDTKSDGEIGFVRRESGIGQNQGLANRTSFFAPVERFRRFAGRRQYDAELTVTPRQVIADLGDGGIFLGEQFQDLPSPVIHARHGLGWAADVRQQGGDLRIAVRELPAKFGDSGVVVYER